MLVEALGEMIQDTFGSLPLLTSEAKSPGKVGRKAFWWSVVEAFENCEK
jgi:hypothetical protein